MTTAWRAAEEHKGAMDDSLYPAPCPTDLQHVEAFFSLGSFPAPNVRSRASEALLEPRRSLARPEEDKALSMRAHWSSEPHRAAPASTPWGL